MFAIISHKNNQYKIVPGKEYEVALLDSKEKKVIFSDVMLYSDDKKVVVGEPMLKNVSVEAEIIGSTKGEKVTAIKFKSKKRYKRNLGHRQDYTKIKVLNINLKNEK